VSILNRLRLNSHLDDAAIAAIWTDSALDGHRPAHPHLGICTDCRTRFDLFAGWLEDLRVEASAEVDKAFPAERLAAQHAHIFRRIEAAERPARVIAFPKIPAPLTSRSSHASRWIAAAAAAGLMVGVGVGQMMDLRHALGGETSRSEARLSVGQRPAERPASVVTVSTMSGDEAFLLDLDASLSRPSVPELRAIDDFTPRAGEQPGEQPQ
jgi:hypothetical protein